MKDPDKRFDWKRLSIGCVVLSISILLILIGLMIADVSGKEQFADMGTIGIFIPPASAIHQEVFIGGLIAEIGAILCIIGIILTARGLFNLGEISFWD